MLFTHALLQGISFEDGGVVVLNIFPQNTGSGVRTTQALSFVDGGGLGYRLPIFVLQKTVGQGQSSRLSFYQHLFLIKQSSRV